jgi:hypothetical protein
VDLELVLIKIHLQALLMVVQVAVVAAHHQQIHISMAAQLIHQDKAMQVVAAIVQTQVTTLWVVAVVLVKQVQMELVQELHLLVVMVVMVLQLQYQDHQSPTAVAVVLMANRLQEAAQAAQAVVETQVTLLMAQLVLQTEAQAVELVDLQQLAVRVAMVVQE